jgi:CBS domain-containing protein
LTAINIDAGQVVESLNRRVRDVMTTPVVAAAPVTDIRRIAAVMLDHGVDGAPIINDTGLLIGFISRSDVLRAIVTDPPLSLWR